MVSSCNHFFRSWRIQCSQRILICNFGWTYFQLSRKFNKTSCNMWWMLNSSELINKTDLAHAEKVPSYATIESMMERPGPDDGAMFVMPLVPWLGIGHHNQHTGRGQFSPMLWILWLSYTQSVHLKRVASTTPSLEALEKSLSADLSQRSVRSGLNWKDDIPFKSIEFHWCWFMIHTFQEGTC